MHTVLFATLSSSIGNPAKDLVSCPKNHCSEFPAVSLVVDSLNFKSNLLFGCCYHHVQYPTLVCSAMVQQHQKSETACSEWNLSWDRLLPHRNVRIIVGTGKHWPREEERLWGSWQCIATHLWCLALSQIPFDHIWSTTLWSSVSPHKFLLCGPVFLHVRCI